MLLRPISAILLLGLIRLLLVLHRLVRRLLLLVLLPHLDRSGDLLRHLRHLRPLRLLLPHRNRRDVMLHHRLLWRRGRNETRLLLLHGLTLGLLGAQVLATLLLLLLWGQLLLRGLLRLCSWSRRPPFVLARRPVSLLGDMLSSLNIVHIAEEAHFAEIFS